MLSDIRRIMRWGKGARRKRIAVSIAHVVLWPILLIPRLFWPWRRAEALAEDCRILLLRMDGIGDLAMSCASIESLRKRFPRARIDLLTSNVAEPIAHLLASAGWINTVYMMPLLGRTISQYIDMHARFRQVRYDAALDLRGDARTSLLMWLCGIPRRLGLPGGGLNYLLTDVIDLPEPHHQAEECAEMVRRIGVAEIGAYPQLPLDAKMIAEAEQWLAGHGAAAGRALAAFHVGAFTATKLWPLERFITVAQRLRMASNAQVLLVGGKADAEVSQRFAEQIGGDVIIAAGQTSLPLTAAILSRCAVMIGNDSGPAHLAAYVGCPAVVLFGPGQPDIYQPLSPKVVNMRASRPCEAGCERICARPESACMLEHSVEAVAARATELMRRYSSP